MGSGSTTATDQEPPAVWCRFSDINAASIFITNLPSLCVLCSCRWWFCSVFNIRTCLLCRCVPKCQRKGNAPTMDPAPSLTARRRGRCGRIWGLISVCYSQLGEEYRKHSLVSRDTQPYIVTYVDTYRLWTLIGLCACSDWHADDVRPVAGVTKPQAPRRWSPAQPARPRGQIHCHAHWLCWSNSAFTFVFGFSAQV